ncbi:MAG: hypothetical protein GVY35_18015, partial [Bacteroidetes bacterium]|nr:hypothetical protein [Bacteroidota bacterium]
MSVVRFVRSRAVAQRLSICQKLGMAWVGLIVGLLFTTTAHGQTGVRSTRVDLSAAELQTEGKAAAGL